MAESYTAYTSGGAVSTPQYVCSRCGVQYWGNGHVCLQPAYGTAPVYTPQYYYGPWQISDDDVERVAKRIAELLKESE